VVNFRVVPCVWLGLFPPRYHALFYNNLLLSCLAGGVVSVAYSFSMRAGFAFWIYLLLNDMLRYSPLFDRTAGTEPPEQYGSSGWHAVPRRGMALL
jgi:hypothetical protein